MLQFAKAHPRQTAYILFVLAAAVALFGIISSCQEKRDEAHRRYMEGETIILTPHEWHEVPTYNGQCIKWGPKTAQDRIIAEYRDGIEWKWHPIPPTGVYSPAKLRFKGDGQRAYMVLKIHRTEECR